MNEMDCKCSDAEVGEIVLIDEEISDLGNAKTEMKGDFLENVTCSSELEEVILGNEMEDVLITDFGSQDISGEMNEKSVS